MKTVTKIDTKISCYHCGEPCDREVIKTDDKNFCCSGCKLVYELLSENNLCTYYNLNHSPGHSPKSWYDKKYDYLDIAEVKKQLIHFEQNGQTHVTFYLPGMHCSSCIWLLENMPRLQPAVVQSTVNFQRKEVTIVYKEAGITLSGIASMLTAIGYEPLITLNDTAQKKTLSHDKSKVIRIAIAGFCFGNIMMMSFPEYFGLEEVWGQQSIQWLFRYLNLLFSLPVLLYSASGFFISAWKSIRQRHLNIDAPIALAIMVTFLRSVYEILSGTGAGYLDSMTGIVFFMLVGRYVQDRTYDTLSFDRDYKSWFPLAVKVVEAGREVSKPVSRLKVGDMMLIRNQEIIPADAKLVSPHTHIDYSFVSGESAPVAKNEGDLIYAGGRQLDGAILLEVTRSVSKSYLTRLWNNTTEDQKRVQRSQSFVDHINRWFTLAVFIIAALSCTYWLIYDPAKALNALSAVLIVACPCGLLLTASFTNGSVIRLMGRKGCYLKNAAAIEAMANIDTIVLDKTGTITYGSNVAFRGPLTEHELSMAVSLAAQSSHIFSRRIREHYTYTRQLPVEGFREITGMGIEGIIDGMIVRMGSAFFLTGQRIEQTEQSSCVYLSVDGVLKGFFSIGNAYRKDLHQTISALRSTYDLHMLSGDNANERQYLTPFFGSGHLHFHQLPEDKLTYIRRLQAQHKQVMMVGDGLNDAHAFRQSEMSLAVSDDTNNFSPACDAILAGSSFQYLPVLLTLAKQSRHVIAACFAFSLLYNIAGLFFAVQGVLSPVIAAILMPASSISIVLISTISVHVIGRNMNKKLPVDTDQSIA